VVVDCAGKKAANPEGCDGEVIGSNAGLPFDAGRGGRGDWSPSLRGRLRISIYRTSTAGQPVNPEYGDAIKTRQEPGLRRQRRIGWTEGEGIYLTMSVSLPLDGMRRYQRSYLERGFVSKLGNSRVRRRFFWPQRCSTLSERFVSLALRQSIENTLTRVPQISNVTDPP